MAYKYKLKDERFLESVTHYKGVKYVGSECSQKDFEVLYNAGVSFIAREEVKPKKEVKKKDESKDEQQG